MGIYYDDKWTSNSEVESITYGGRRARPHSVGVLDASWKPMSVKVQWGTMRSPRHLYKLGA